MTRRRGQEAPKSPVSESSPSKWPTRKGGRQSLQGPQASTAESVTRWPIIHRPLAPPHALAFSRPAWPVEGQLELRFRERTTLNIPNARKPCYYTTPDHLRVPLTPVPLGFRPICPQGEDQNGWAWTSLWASLWRARALPGKKAQREQASAPHPTSRKGGHLSSRLRWSQDPGSRQPGPRPPSLWRVRVHGHSLPHSVSHRSAASL